jgi:RNA recognition motif-containing protein
VVLFVGMMKKRVRVEFDDGVHVMVGLSDVETVMDVKNKLQRVMGEEYAPSALLVHGALLFPEDRLEDVLLPDESIVAKRGLRVLNPNVMASSDSTGSSSSDSSSSSSSSSSSDSSSDSSSSVSVAVVAAAVSQPQLRLTSSQHQDAPAPREACRLYMGALPKDVDANLLRAFVTGVLAASGVAVTTGAGAVVDVQHNSAKQFAFVEFADAHLTSRALELLSGQTLHNKSIRVGRPASYVPTATTTPGKDKAKEKRAEQNAVAPAQKPQKGREQKEQNAAAPSPNASISNNNNNSGGDFDSWKKIGIMEANIGDEVCFVLCLFCLCVFHCVVCVCVLCSLPGGLWSWTRRAGLLASLGPGRAARWRPWTTCARCCGSAAARRPSPGQPSSTRERDSRFARTTNK